MKDFKTFFRKTKIHSSNIKLTSYSGGRMPTHGSYMLKIEHKDISHKVLFVVAKNDEIPILGEKVLEK